MRVNERESAGPLAAPRHAGQCWGLSAEGFGVSKNSISLHLPAWNILGLVFSVQFKAENKYCSFHLLATTIPCSRAVGRSARRPTSSRRAGAGTEKTYASFTYSSLLFNIPIFERILGFFNADWNCSQHHFIYINPNSPIAARTPATWVGSISPQFRAKITPCAPAPKAARTDSFTLWAV